MTVESRTCRCFITRASSINLWSAGLQVLLCATWVTWAPHNRPPPPKKKRKKHTAKTQSTTATNCKWKFYPCWQSLFWGRRKWFQIVLLQPLLMAANPVPIEAASLTLKYLQGSIHPRSNSTWTSWDLGTTHPWNPNSKHLIKLCTKKNSGQQTELAK